MSLPRPLLITGTPPGTRSAGGLFLKSIVDACYGADAPALVVDRSPGGPDASEMAGEAAWMAAEQQTDLVWIILDSRRSMDVLVALKALVPMPCAVTLWDPIERIADLEGSVREELRAKFRDAVTGASAMSVVSEEMAREYEVEFGVRTHVVRYGVPAPNSYRRVHVAAGTDFTIGFAGSVYSIEPWLSLLDALDAASWRIGDRGVRVIAYADAPPSLSHSRIEWRRWLPEEPLIDALSHVDMCYLPSWFDECNGAATRLCFPSKLATYLATGRPVFFHGPIWAPPARFVTASGCGIVCDSVAPSVVLEQIHSAARPREFRVRRNVASTLTSETFLGAFRRFIWTAAQDRANTVGVSS